MLRSYLTTAIRPRRRHLGHTVISGIGLAVGLACGLLAVPDVQHELSDDDHHAKAERFLSFHRTPIPHAPLHFTPAALTLPLH